MRAAVGLHNGSVQYEVKKMGCLSTSQLNREEGADPILHGPHLNGQLHQRYFCIGLDMAVRNSDGGAGHIAALKSCHDGMSFRLAFVAWVKRRMLPEPIHVHAKSTLSSPEYNPTLLCLTASFAYTACLALVSLCDKYSQLQVMQRLHTAPEFKAAAYLPACLSVSLPCWQCHALLAGRVTQPLCAEQAFDIPIARQCSRCTVTNFQVIRTLYCWMSSREVVCNSHRVLGHLSEQIASFLSLC